MGKDKATLEDELATIIQKLRIWEKKYPRLFAFFVGEDKNFPEEKNPTPEEREEIQKLKAKRDKLKNKLRK